MELGFRKIGIRKARAGGIRRQMLREEGKEEMENSGNEFGNLASESTTFAHRARI